MKKRKLEAESTSETKQKKLRTRKDREEFSGQGPAAPVVIAPAAVDNVAAVAAKKEKRNNGTLPPVAATVPIDAAKPETAGYLDSILRYTKRYR